MGEFLGYWRLVWNRAVSDFAKFLRSHIPGLLVAFFGTAAVLPLVQYAGADAAQEGVLLILSGLVGPLVVAVALFGWSFLMAPPRLHRDATEKISSQQETIRRLRLARYDYSHWDKVDSFLIWHAACLWIDEPPNKATMSLGAIGCMERIKSAIRGKAISLDGAQHQRLVLDEFLSSSGQNWPSPIPDDASVRRGQLVKLAGLDGVRPPFLFPDERDAALSVASGGLSDEPIRRA